MDVKTAWQAMSMASEINKHSRKWQVDLEFVPCGGLAILFCWNKPVCEGPTREIMTLCARMQKEVS
jgi:hypothetical protein